MSLAQENFERAVDSADITIAAVKQKPPLAEEDSRRLSTWLWDLEAIAVAIRQELMERPGNNPPVDFA